MTIKILAQNVPEIFGTIKPPISGMPEDPVSAVSQFFGFGIKAFILVCAMFVLLYMMWGAFDWITSSGEKDKVAKAQNKITTAVIGIFILIGVFTIYSLIAGDILHLIEIKDGVWKFNIPFLGQ